MIPKGITILIIAISRCPLLQWKEYLNTKYYRFHTYNQSRLNDVKLNTSMVL